MRSLFEQASFRDDDDVAGPQVNVVIDVPAGEKVVVIENERRLHAINFSAHLDALSRGERTESTCLSDGLHDVSFRAHDKIARSKNLTGDVHSRFQVLFQWLDAGKSH